MDRVSSPPAKRVDCKRLGFDYSIFRLQNFVIVCPTPDRRILEQVGCILLIVNVGSIPTNHTHGKYPAG